MAQATLDQVISQLDTFQLKELDRLEKAIQEHRAATEAAEKQPVFHQALLASGLVKRIAYRTEPDTTERRPIEVQGELVSETLLRSADRCLPSLQIAAL